MAFGAPAFLQDWRAPLTSAEIRRQQPRRYDTKILLSAFLLCQTLTLALTIANLHVQGFPALDALADPIGTGCSYLVSRYRGEIDPTAFSQAATLLNYIGTVTAGLLLVRTYSLPRQFGVALFAIVPSLIFMMLYGDKGTVFLSIAYMYGAVIVARIAVQAKCSKI